MWDFLGHSWSSRGGMKPSLPRLSPLFLQCPKSVWLSTSCLRLVGRLSHAWRVCKSWLSKETSSKRWQKPLTGQRHHLRIKQAMDGLRMLHDPLGLFLEPEATTRTDDYALWIKEEILPKGPFYLHGTELHDWYFFLAPFSNNFKLDDLFFLVHLRAVYRVMYRAFLVHLSAKLEISLCK